MNQLTRAIYEGNLKKVNQILSSGVDKRVLDSGLVTAALSNHANIFKRLLDAGADVNHLDSAGYAPLHRIFDDPIGDMGQKLEILKLLVESPDIQIDKKTTDMVYQQTPLVAAVRKTLEYGPNYIEFVKILLDHGANPNISYKKIPDMDFRHQGFRLVNAYIVDSLLDNLHYYYTGTYPENRYRIINLNMLKLLLEYGARPSLDRLHKLTNILNTKNILKGLQKHALSRRRHALTAWVRARKAMIAAEAGDEEDNEEEDGEKKHGEKKDGEKKDGEKNGEEHAAAAAAAASPPPEYAGEGMHGVANGGAPFPPAGGAGSGNNGSLADVLAAFRKTNPKTSNKRTFKHRKAVNKTRRKV